jgi:CBS domain containing-hemolysin-like protein
MKAVLKFLVGVFAIALIVAGLVLTFSPIPGGIIILTLGVSLLAMVSPAAVRVLRRRWKAFDRFMHAVERYLPGFLARRLRQSDHEHEDETDEAAEKTEREKSARAAPVRRAAPIRAASRKAPRRMP